MVIANIDTIMFQYNRAQGQFSTSHTKSDLHAG